MSLLVTAICFADASIVFPIWRIRVVSKHVLMTRDVQSCHTCSGSLRMSANIPHGRMSKSASPLKLEADGPRFLLPTMHSGNLQMIRWIEDGSARFYVVDCLFTSRLPRFFSLVLLSLHVLPKFSLVFVLVLLLVRFSCILLSSSSSSWCILFEYTNKHKDCQ